MSLSFNSGSPTKWYERNRDVVVRRLAWLFCAAVLFFSYHYFYPSQLVGPFNVPIFTLAICLVIGLMRSIVTLAPIDPNHPPRSSTMDKLALGAALFLAIWTILLGMADAVEHAINQQEWRTTTYPITGIDRGHRRRSINADNIQFDVEGQWLPAEITIPTDQFEELKDGGYAGLCVVVPTRPAILNRTQIWTGCPSSLCSITPAKLVPCDGQ